MPALSQYRAATGRSAVTYPEDLVRAQVPRLAEIRARQYQSDQLDLAERGLTQQGDAQRQQQAAISQATGVQGIGTLVSTAGLVESVWPGTISGAANSIGSSLGLTSAAAPAVASGTAEASGVASTGAATVGEIGAASSVPIGIEAGGVAGAAEVGVGVGGGTTAAEGAAVSAGAGAGALGSAAIPGIGGGLAGGLLGAQLIGPLVPFGGKREKAATGGAIGGALGGALAGAAATSWSGPGALIGGAIGAVVGGISGLVSGGSVIATATFGIHSPQTQLALQYRRKFIGTTAYIGYRLWADPIARAMEHGQIMDVDVRRVLVEPCIRAMAADLLGLPPYCYVWERAYLKLWVEYSRVVGKAAVRQKRVA